MNHQPIPHLETALSGPLQQLERDLLKHQVSIETWFRKQWQEVPTPFTSSVDLRNAGFKLAPVDTNLFPAGFNNLSKDMIPLGIQAAQSTLDKSLIGCERILLIPENHTRNMFYLESLATIQEILNKAGFEVKIGSLLPDLDKSLNVALPSGRALSLEPLQRKDNQLFIDNYSPCLIILNNDLSEGIPELLKDITQTIRPPLNAGWSHRFKSTHFKHYNQVALDFAELIGIDPWLINPLFRYCGELDFVRREGEDALVGHIEQLLTDIQKKYDTYGIKQKPFVMVKADAGTYGMGVMTIDNPEKIRSLNRKERARMSSSKGKKSVSRVLIQEGVYSFETWGDDKAVAEPVVYMIGHHVIGGFYRIHKQRGPHENLNAPGMEFEPLAFAESCNNPDLSSDASEAINRFYSYGVVARLALLAAAHEIKEISA